MKTDNMISQSAIYNFIKTCEEHDNINLINFVLIQGDNVLAQFCKKPYKKDCKQLLFSMTKSFTSLAAGIAIDKGLLQLDDYVVSFFKDNLPQNPHDNLLKMQVRHLLTMTTGIHENTYGELFPQPNWIKAFLAQEFPHIPGTYYKYSTHATHMLSAIIQKISGQSLEEFLNVNMFFPMNITEAEWELSPEGLTAGGMGLSLYPSSLIKVAFLLLNKGVYHEKRIISEEYLVLATSPQTIKQDHDESKFYSGYQYGFQFHIGQNGCYRAEGAFGQFCVVCPDKNIAVIATSQHTDTESFLALIDNYYITQQNDDYNILRDYFDKYLSDLSFSLPGQNNIALYAHLTRYEPGVRLYKMISDYLKEYGLIALKGYTHIVPDIIQEKPWEVLGKVRACMGMCREIYNESLNKTLLDKKRILDQITDSLEENDRKDFMKNLRTAEKSFLVNDDHCFYIDLTSQGYLRLALKKAGDVLTDKKIIEQSEDTYFLKLNEILNSLVGEVEGLDVKIRSRKEKHNKHKKLIPPEYLGKATDTSSTTNKTDVMNDVLKGVSGLGKRVSGRIKVINDSTRNHDIKEDCILVLQHGHGCYFLPVMNKIKGLIYDEGSPFDHPGILAREFEIPSIYKTGNATKVLRDGDLVELDGITGVVRILDRA